MEYELQDEAEFEAKFAGVLQHGDQFYDGKPDCVFWSTLAPRRQRQQGSRRRQTARLPKLSQ